MFVNLSLSLSICGHIYLTTYSGPNRCAKQQPWNLALITNIEGYLQKSINKSRSNQSNNWPYPLAFYRRYWRIPAVVGFPRTYDWSLCLYPRYRVPGLFIKYEILITITFCLSRFWNWDTVYNGCLSSLRLYMNPIYYLRKFYNQSKLCLHFRWWIV